MPVTFSTMFSRFPSRNTYLQYQYLIEFVLCFLVKVPFGNVKKERDNLILANTVLLDLSSEQYFNDFVLGFLLIFFLKLVFLLINILLNLFLVSL